MGRIANSAFYVLIILMTGFICACNSNPQHKTLPKDTLQIRRKTDTLGGKVSGPVKIFQPPEIGYKIIGYIIDSRKPEEVSERKFEQCNVVVYSSAKALAGNIVEVKYPGNLRIMVTRAHRNKTKILLGVAGQPEHFKTLAKTIEKRTKCIMQIMALVRLYGVDGVDLDWEFPLIEDKTSLPFTLFVKQLADSCHANGRYYLSCAVAPGINKVKRARAIRTELLTGSWVDWFNIMIYDAFSVTKPHVQHSKEAYNSFIYWRRVRKMAKEKCVLGMPFYGRPSGIPQKGRVLSFKTILKEGGSAYSDSAIIKTNKPISVKDTSKQYTIYYDGIKTIRRKAIGAKHYGGGIMFWELGMDTEDKYSLLTAAVNAVNSK